jgi:hypothetical protein
MPEMNAVQQLIIAVDFCFEKRLIAPTLALLYSGIDTMAWLGLPDNQQDVTGEDFVQWVDRYLLPDSGVPCTAVDLYSSRCGIVHSMTGESRAIRRGAARRVFYAWGNHRAEDLQKILDRIGQPILAVQVDTLVRAFHTATDRFVTASEQDPELNRRVGSRLGKVFTDMQLPSDADATPQEEMPACAEPSL